MTNKIAVAAIASVLLLIGSSEARSTLNKDASARAPGSFVVADIPPVPRYRPEVPKPAPVPPDKKKPLPERSSPFAQMSPLRWLVAGSGVLAALLIALWRQRERLA